jgi:putative component of membrane protein insertase Oxa1/YidC/SpoIIIJ protein YidD
MKVFLLLIIKLYWVTFPKTKRRKCIFKISCSKYVYQITKEEGLHKGLITLRYRFQNCRSGFIIFENPTNGRKMIMLPNAQILSENEISERFS